jgi:hypothetical protein
MSKKSYAKLLDEALTPLGFRRDGDNWIRVRDDMWECVDRYSSWLGGVKITLQMLDLKTDELHRQLLGEAMVPASESLGHLIDGRDRKWGDAPEHDGDGQAMVAALLAYGLPWFDRVRTLQEQAEHWYARRARAEAPRIRGVARTICLALTLHRMGEKDEACHLLSKPLPRTRPTVGAEVIARVREHLGCSG